MRPNTLKISDWKEIRRRISKVKAEEWRHTFQENFSEMRRAEKYSYRTEGKKVFRFDTVFYIIPQFAYPELASEVEWFLQKDLENSYRDQEEYEWMPFYYGAGLLTEIGFLDADIAKERSMK